MTALLRDAFLAAMSHAAQTVSIISTDGAAGRAGVTVSAMASVSADAPQPTLLTCVHHLSPAAGTILANGCFCVNVLADDQSYIAETFAGRFKDQVADKFDCADWQAMATGSPRIVDALAAFDCTVMSTERIGTHHIFIGAVQQVFTASRGRPLIYAHRAYGSPNRIEPATTLTAGRKAQGQRLAIGCFHSFGPAILPDMIRRLTQAVPTEITLIEGDQRRVTESLRAGEVEVALLYDLGLTDDLDCIPLMDLAPYVLLGAGHPLAGKPRLAAADLAGHPMILLSAPPSGDYFVSLLRDAGVEPQVALRSSSVEMVRGLVGQGLGYAILATLPASDVSYDGRALVTRPLDTETPPSRIVLARRRGVALSAAAERFTFLTQAHFATDA